MRDRRILIALCCMPLLASCVFLLDYDQLQDGEEATGQGGVPTASGGTGNAESGAGGAGCGDCDDHDPCTVDTCDETGDVATCMHMLSEGLKLDGFEQVVEAEQHVRVSLVAGTDVFYLAALTAEGDGADVTLYKLDRDGTELEQLGNKIASLLPAGATMVSNVGLAVDPALGGLAVHGFFAAKPLAGKPNVYHLLNRDGDSMINQILGASYSVHSPWVFPQVLTIGNAVFGGWIQEDGTIAVHEVGALMRNVFGDVMIPATTLALLSSPADEPAVMFTSQTETTMGAYVESISHARAEITECQTGPGTYLSSAVIDTQVPGLWLNNITRAGDDYLTTGGATLVCGPALCTAVTEECNPQEDLANNVRNIAGATVQADAAGIVYAVTVLPQIGLKMGSTTEVEARLSMGLGRVDFSVEPPVFTTIGGDDVLGLMEVARQDTDESAMFTGPDWPAVGILPTKQVALAWIQPNEMRSGTELHVQRYQICAAEE